MIIHVLFQFLTYSTVQLCHPIGTGEWLNKVRLPDCCTFCTSHLEIENVVKHAKTSRETVPTYWYQVQVMSTSAVSSEHNTTRYPCGVCEIVVDFGTYACL